MASCSWGHMTQAMMVDCPVIARVSKFMKLWHRPSWGPRFIQDALFELLYMTHANCFMPALLYLASCRMLHSTWCGVANPVDSALNCFAPGHWNNSSMESMQKRFEFCRKQVTQFLIQRGPAIQMGSIHSSLWSIHWRPLVSHSLRVSTGWSCWDELLNYPLPCTK